LIDLAEQTGVAAGMAYCLRYHPAYVLAHKYVREGRLGSTERVTAWFESYLPEWHPWEDYRQGYAARADLGGGVLPTLDHEIDFVCWCCGPPQSCAGASSRSGLLDSDVDDTARLALSYPGYTAEIELSICRRERRRGFEWIGDRAVLSFSFERQTLRWTNRDGTDAETVWQRPDFDLDEMYVAMLGDALRAVAAKEPMPISLRAGLDALRVAAAATHQGQTQPAHQARPRDLARGKPT
jgi:predicted dehydrogenase